MRSGVYIYILANSLLFWVGKQFSQSQNWRKNKGGHNKNLSKIEEWHLHPPLSIWRPWSFPPWSSPGCPYLCLNGTLFVMLVDLSFSFFSFLSFPLFSSLFLSLSFIFIFWRPFSDPGAEAPKAPPEYAPVHEIVIFYCSSNSFLLNLFSFKYRFPSKFCIFQ